MVYQTPDVEDLQLIQNKLKEASSKIYEALELAAQLKLHPRHLSNLVSMIEHSNGVYQDLLQAAEKPAIETRFNRIPMYGGAIGLAMPSHRLGDINPEEMERMKTELTEQLRGSRVIVNEPMQDGH